MTMKAFAVPANSSGDESGVSRNPFRRECDHAPCRGDGGGREVYQELDFPALQKGGHEKETYWLFSERDRHNQPTCASMEIRRRHRSPRALKRRVCEQRVRRGLRLEIPPIGDDPGGEAPPCCAVGTSSIESKPSPRAKRAQDCLAFLDTNLKAGPCKDDPVWQWPLPSTDFDCVAPGAAAKLTSYLGGHETVATGGAQSCQ
jgi:hypothetical protein